MNLREKYLGLIKKAEARIGEIDKNIEASEDAKELKVLQLERNKLVSDIADYRSILADLPEDKHTDPAPADPAPAQRTQPQPPFNPMGTYQMAGVTAGDPAKRAADTDPYATIEYRTAFMAFAKTGRVTPELRLDAMTQTSDVSAVIPSTILNEIVKKLTVYGQLFSRVRKLSVKGGVTVPILSLLPTATWIGEATPSERKKVQSNTNVSFSYYGLECKVSTSLLADTVTLTGFENTVTDLIVEAMVKAMDTAIVSGSGEGQFLGITKDTRVPAAQVVTLGSADFVTWDGWKRKVFAKMPLAYKGGAIFIMASGTFEGYIDGMVDAQGQPIGRVNYGITDGAQERFGGKEVVLVEDDIIAPYDDANVGDVVAIYCNLRNYAINSNMQMTMFRYLDHDTNEWIDKAILIADGKLVDPYGVVVIKKGA